MIVRVAHLLLRVFSSVALLGIPAFSGTIIHVPAQQPTIQAGINAASNGDTVLVAPGTYYENINFNGKAITVASSNGAKVTIIDGGGLAPVAAFVTKEGPTSVLSGFTLQNGLGTFSFGYMGGAVSISSASPTIKQNVMKSNTADYGGGVGVYWGSPIITGNTITGNSAQFGGGVSFVGDASSGQLIKNTISFNQGGAGAGVSLNGARNLLVENNKILSNSAFNATDQGGGLWLANESDEVIVQNVIAKNICASGSQVYAYASSANGWMLINNTIVSAPNGGADAAVIADGATTYVVIENNIISAASDNAALLCNPVYHLAGPPIVKFNDASNPFVSYGDSCTGFDGVNGNISANPAFVTTSNYQLKGGSPAIDAGTNSAPNLPAKDFVNNPRIINGNGLATAIVDMGVYEFVPVVLAPKSLSFGLQAVGSTISKPVKLTNAKNKVLNVSSYTVPIGYAVSGCGSSIAAFTSCTLTITFHPLTSGTFKGSLAVKDDAGNSPQTVVLSGSAN